MTKQHSDENDGVFGLCPICHKTDGYHNVGRSHWFRCDTHRVKWCYGSNIFSSWRFETEQEQREKYDAGGYGFYKEVEPFFYPPEPDDDRVIAHVGHVDPSDSSSPYLPGWSLLITASALQRLLTDETERRRFVANLPKAGARRRDMAEQPFCPPDPPDKDEDADWPF